MTKIKQFIDDNIATYKATNQVPYIFAVRQAHAVLGRFTIVC